MTDWRRWNDRNLQDRSAGAEHRHIIHRRRNNWVTIIYNAPSPPGSNKSAGARGRSRWVMTPRPLLYLYIYIYITSWKSSGRIETFIMLPLISTDYMLVSKNTRLDITLIRITANLCMSHYYLLNLASYTVCVAPRIKRERLLLDTLAL